MFVCGVTTKLNPLPFLLKQFFNEPLVVEPLPMKEGKAKRVDYEYKRTGTAVVLLAYNMDTGQRHMVVSDTKNKVDYATFIAQVMDTHYTES